MPSKVGTKGQIVIEKEIRDRLGIEPGAMAIQQVVDGHLEVHFLPAPHNRSLLGILRPYVSDELLERAEKMDWSEIRERAWREAVEEEYGDEARNE
jgi:AbrB family looped-hinge helix DNA binding protein